jgi:hypothetical protein
MLSTVYDVENINGGIVTDCDRHISLNLVASSRKVCLTRNTNCREPVKIVAGALISFRRIFFA